MIFRCVVFRRNGAEILTVLLVVVSLGENICSTFEIDQLPLTGLAFLSGLSPRRVLAGKRKRALPWEIPRTTPVFDWGLFGFDMGLENLLCRHLKSGHGAQSADTV